MAHGSRASFGKRNRERTKRLKRMEKLQRRQERRARNREERDGLPAGPTDMPGVEDGATADGAFTSQDGALTAQDNPVSATPAGQDSAASAPAPDTTA